MTSKSTGLQLLEVLNFNHWAAKTHGQFLWHFYLTRWCFFLPCSFQVGSSSLVQLRSALLSQSNQPPHSHPPTTGMFEGKVVHVLNSAGPFLSDENNNISCIFLFDQSNHTISCPFLYDQNNHLISYPFLSDESNHITSLAGSATLGGTSWARFKFELTHKPREQAGTWIMPDS